MTRDAPAEALPPKFPPLVALRPQISPPLSYISRHVDFCSTAETLACNASLRRAPHAATACEGVPAKNRVIPQPLAMDEATQRRTCHSDVEKDDARKIPLA